MANSSRPSFTLVEPLDDDGSHNPHSQVVDQEIDAYLYGEGECPFVFVPPDLGRIRPGVGWRVSDRDENDRERMCEAYESEGNEQRISDMQLEDAIWFRPDV
jgi:hypothetical protein